LTGSPSEIVFVPYDQASREGFEDMPRRVPDLTKIRTLIGYRPTVPLDEILKRVIRYYHQLERRGLATGTGIPRGQRDRVGTPQP
jgi:UDP-glucose 4-epimerase